MTCDPDCKDRTMCNEAGKVGHYSCGTCSDCNGPRHHCGHILILNDKERAKQ